MEPDTTEKQDDTGPDRTPAPEPKAIVRLRGIAKTFWRGEEPVKVLENLDNQGYHLQMPPAEDEYIEHLPEELLRRNDPV